MVERLLSYNTHVILGFVFVARKVFIYLEQAALKRLELCYTCVYSATFHHSSKIDLNSKKSFYIT